MRFTHTMGYHVAQKGTKNGHMLYKPQKHDAEERSQSQKTTGPIYQYMACPE